jgi:hypothetical protein
LNIFRKSRNKSKANEPNPLAAQWHSIAAAGLRSVRGPQPHGPQLWQRPTAPADAGCTLVQHPERRVRCYAGGAGLRPGDAQWQPRCARQGIGRRAGAREMRDRGRPHRWRSWVSRKGEQEHRRGGKSGGARTSLPARGVGGDVSDSVATALDKARPNRAAALRLETAMTCAGRRRG